jgi:hypothetical protein
MLLEERSVRRVERGIDVSGSQELSDDRAISRREASAGSSHERVDHPF